MRLLLLTSPELHGQDVHDVQAELARHGADPGPLDGIYGPATANAVRRFQRSARLRVDGIVGPQTLAALAADEAPEPPAEHVGKFIAGPLALEWMRARIGMREEPPDSNVCPISREFGIGAVPWCMEAVSLAFKHGANLILGDQAPAPWGFWPGRGFAYVPAFEAWAKTRGYWIGRTRAEHGDVVVYDWNGDGLADHVGIVDTWTGGGRFVAIEGNTGIGNDSNGGELMRRDRYVSTVRGFARISFRQP